MEFQRHVVKLHLIVEEEIMLIIVTQTCHLAERSVYVQDRLTTTMNTIRDPKYFSIRLED